MAEQLPLSPASIAGEPGKSAMVSVIPPLFCRGPSSGSETIVPSKVAHGPEPSSTILFPPDTEAVPKDAHSVPPVLFANILLFNILLSAALPAK